MKRIKKLLAAVLALALVVTGLYITEPKVNAAANGATAETLFAGYYEDADFTIPSKVETEYAKYVDSSVLSVKVQTQPGKTDGVANGTTNMRVLATVDSLNYATVGFDIWFAEDISAVNTSDKNAENYLAPINFQTTTVFKNIKAVDTDSVSYEFSPKLFDADSEYFVSGTIKGIASAKTGYEFYIRPYWTTFDGTKVYGESKCVAIDDQGKTNINMTVEANDPGVATTIPVSVAGGAAVDAELLKWEDGYACINIPVTDKTALKSVSTVEVTDANLKVADTKSSFRNVKTVYDGTEASKDTSWYNADDSKFVLVTSADLYGFASLNNNFADKKVCLASDITVNSGTPLGADGVKDTADDTTPDDWSNATVGSKLLAWTPVANFAGTFDGDMNTISGIYLKANKGSTALFANVSGTVQNFVLENSYIENQMTAGTGATGSVVGTLSGTLDTVKSSAYVKLNGSEYAGGMVGIMTGSAGTIKNCWFDGTVSGSCSHQSAFLGGMPNSNAKGYMVNCLSTGKIDMRANTGGLVGTFWNSGVELTIENSLFGGEFVNVDASVWGNFGTLAAQVQKGTIKANNVYTNTRSYEYKGVTKNAGLLGNAGSNTNTGMASLDAALLKDESAYMNLDLDFFIDDVNEEAKWLAVENDYPILASFAENEQAVDLATVSGARTFWHKATADADEFVLYTPADFRGFQQLSKTETFAGDTVKLGADINLNPNWDASQPAVGTSTKMDPIGSFAGTFDGDMHKVEGVYIVSGVANTGLFSEVSGTVKNLILENSRIENTITTNTEGRTGSVIGQLTGTLDTVKSDAYVVVSGSQYAGGLVGVCNGTAATVKVNNSWFAGSVSGSGERHGGLVGGINAMNVKAEMNNCLVTGEISLSNHRGGFIGAAWGAGINLKITDCLFAGHFASGSASNNFSNTFGRLVRGTIEFNNVYIFDGPGVVNANTGDKYNDGNSTSNMVINSPTRLKDYQLAFDEAKVNTALTICEEADYGNEEVVGKTKFWYVADKHPVLASFSEVPAYSKLKVATYNIKYCINHGQTPATTASIRNDVANFIKTNNIDICLLQEVDGNCVRSEGKNQAEEIAKTLGTEWTYKYQETVSNPLIGRTSYGLAIVSKYPIVSSSMVPINENGQDEPRVILKTMINVDGTQVAVINTHVDDTDEGTSTAISEAQKMINAIPASTPIIFGGDLNDIPTQSTPIAIGELLASVTAGRPAVTTHASMQIDYLFTSNRFAQGLTEVLNPTCSAEDLADQPISDHKPLVATLYLKAQ